MTGAAWIELLSVGPMGVGVIVTVVVGSLRRPVRAAARFEDEIRGYGARSGGETAALVAELSARDRGRLLRGGRLPAVIDLRTEQGGNGDANGPSLGDGHGGGSGVRGGNGGKRAPAAGWGHVEPAPSGGRGHLESGEPGAVGAARRAVCHLIGHRPPRWISQALGGASRCRRCGEALR